MHLRTRKILTNQRGVSLLLVLIMVAVVGAAAAVAGSTWQTIMQRSREAELLFRGNQYRQAIEGYYKATHGGTSGMLPAELEHLLKDPRFPGAVRYIRQLYRDPMTNAEFEIIREQLSGGRIKGVRSTSNKEPFKKDGFTKENEKFKNASSYQSWEFVFEPPRLVKKTVSGQPSQTK